MYLPFLFSFFINITFFPTLQFFPQSLNFQFNCCLFFWLFFRPIFWPLFWACFLGLLGGGSFLGYRHRPFGQLCFGSAASGKKSNFCELSNQRLADFAQIKFCFDENILLLILFFVVLRFRACAVKEVIILRMPSTPPQSNTLFY